MFVLNIFPDIDPETGTFIGSFVPNTNGITFSGSVGHGNTLTINDIHSRFGTRANVKPLFVNMGDSLFGSALGRITTKHMNDILVIDNAIKAGALSSSLKWDARQHGDTGMLGQPVATQDQTKPVIQYVERRYGFDFDDPGIQNNAYYFGQWDYNNTISRSFYIDGRTYTHTNDGTVASRNNANAVRDYFISLINADALCKCTASVNDGRLILTKKNINEYFVVTTSATYMNEIYQNFNNKTARVWPRDGSNTTDAILITRSNTDGQSYIENEEGSTLEPYYNPKPDYAEFMNEELVFVNSSAANVPDGYYHHYKNGELLNPTMLVVTYNTGEQPLGRCFLNQMSNGPYGYWLPELIMHVGYQCWDDEYRGIYIADSNVLVPGVTKLVRQPQTAWVAGSVSFQQVYSLVDPENAHAYFRTDKNTFTYLGRIPS